MQYPINSTSQERGKCPTLYLRNIEAERCKKILFFWTFSREKGDSRSFFHPFLIDFVHCSSIRPQIPH